MTSEMEAILRKIRPQQSAPIEGYIWINMLVHYKLDGTAEVVRSFTNPAKESTIKKVAKPKKEINKISVSKEMEEEELFD